jgi:hypothetical protein
VNLSYTLGVSVAVGERPSITAPSVTTRVKNLRERSEGAELVKLTLVDEGYVVQMHSEERVFARGELLGVDWPPLVRYQRMAAGHSALTALAIPEGVATLTRHYTVEELDSETLHGLETLHFQLTIRNSTTGTLGESETVETSEWWVATEVPALSWPDRFHSRSYEFTVGKCRITAHCSGDGARLAELLGRMWVRRVQELPIPTGMTTTTVELLHHSTEPLDDTLFAIPSDYREVSEKELNDRLLARVTRPPWKR